MGHPVDLLVSSFCEIFLMIRVNLTHILTSNDPIEKLRNDFPFMKIMSNYFRRGRWEGAPCAQYCHDC